MLRPRFLSALLCANLLAASVVCGQQVTPPNTAAGHVLAAWLDAFNSGDSARLADYYRRYEPKSMQEVSGMLGFRRQTGGFELRSVELSQPRHLEFIVKERNSPTQAMAILDVTAGDPPTVTSFPILAMGPNVTAADYHIDAAERKRAIEGAIAQLDEYYVFPDVARRMADSLHARLARGAYDDVSNGLAFAERIGGELRDVGHDKHLRMNFSARPLPVQQAGAPAAPSPDQRSRMQKQMDDMNCAFERVERLEGNIGYLKFNGFADPEFCAQTAAAAMTFIAGTRALIIDLRENGGGSPDMVALLASYLFDDSTHVNDLWTRKTDETKQFWTQPHAPGKHFGSGKPIYVLTSSRTFSGAEEFSYDLQAQKRATIVGEVTGGGAHPVAGRRVDEHFIIGVPGARAINPITHTNWEGVGIAPDVKVPAAAALDTARKLAADSGRRPAS